MSNSLFILIRDAGRLALYSLVLGPALLLYGIVVNIAMEGSLSERFVQEARNLTEGAPAGKVMQWNSSRRYPTRERISARFPIKFRQYPHVTANPLTLTSG